MSAQHNSQCYLPDTGVHVASSDIPFDVQGIVKSSTETMGTKAHRQGYTRYIVAGGEQLSGTDPVFQTEWAIRPEQDET
jgi:hypothetical protein